MCEHNSIHAYSSSTPNPRRYERVRWNCCVRVSLGTGGPTQSTDAFLAAAGAYERPIHTRNCFGGSAAEQLSDLRVSRVLRLPSAIPFPTYTDLVITIVFFLSGLG